MDQGMYYLNNTEKDRRLITLFLILKLVTNVTIDFNAAPPTLHKQSTPSYSNYQSSYFYRCSIVNFITHKLYHLNVEK
jgi:hypothetical protein